MGVRVVECGSHDPRAFLGVGTEDHVSDMLLDIVNEQMADFAAEGRQASSGSC